MALAHGIEALLPPLCALGKASIAGARNDFAPLLPSTLSTLTAAFAHSTQPSLIGLADELFCVFCDAPGADSSFASMLDQLAEPALARLTAASTPLDHPDLLCAILTIATKIAKLLAPALAAARCLPSLLSLSLSQLPICRQVEPAEAIVAFLEAVGRCTRVPHTAGAPSTQAVTQQLRETFSRHVGGDTGAAILDGLIRGLADTLPPRTVAAAADVLAPLLHCDSWPGQAATWAHASLAALPAGADGVPGPQARQQLHDALTTTPDPFAALAEGGGVSLQAVESLRTALSEFARVCRRMADATELDRERYG